VIFTGVEMWFFLPVVLAVYWALPRRAPVQNVFLVAISYVFYASWNPRMVWVIALATAVDYVIGLYIAAQRAQANADGELPAPARRRARVALGVSIAYNLGQLGYFKYAGFFAASLDDLLSALGLGTPLPVLHVLLPLSISFFTLQKLAYAIDVYYGRLPACRSPLTFATFVAFFPQLVAGPIPRGSELLPQLEAPRRLLPSHLTEGAGLFFLGFVKKAFIADYLGQYLVNPVFADPSGYSTLGVWLALVGYSFQVFCDFSGYSEMAIGCARMLGIQLPENFRYPFFARNLIDLWRRWHITLNTWLFDYLYGPMTTGSSWMRGRLDLGFLIVFLISGLWHGAMWTFILWGLLHGIGLVVTRRWDEHYRGLCRKDRSYVALRKSRRYVTAAWLLTQLFFVLTLIPFRAPTLGAAGAMASGLLLPRGGLLVPPHDGTYLQYPMLVLCLALVVGYHLLATDRGQRVRDRFFGLPPFVRGTIYGVAIAFLVLFTPLAAGTFIYANF
jgi:alginate O-acetyltransferase complex protein AlgI